jgi:predicted ATPase
MLRYLKLENFKNFRDATLAMGPLTLLVGANASGKSNLRDAFRVLHGISRGYAAAETLGEKWIEGGVLQWRGIRGGTREAAFLGSSSFALSLGFDFEAEGSLQEACYRIEVHVGSAGIPPSFTSEKLTISGETKDVFRVDGGPSPEGGSLPAMLYIVAHHPSAISKRFAESIPSLSRKLIHSALQELESMRFLDLSPEAMRLPSLPGQIILGDRGENLSSVLQALCQNESSRNALVEWVRALTPLDVVDFEFIPDQIGRILVTLVEQGGRRISAYSASDGTLRFLAMAAAVLGPNPAHFYFLEELENGIHPTRLHLLISLLERKVKQGSIQIVASSHSPQLLSLLSPESFERASLVYRPEGALDARIRRILDIPEAARVVREQAPSSLHASGWFEDAVAFAEGADPQPEHVP